MAFLCIPDIYKRSVHPFRLSRLKVDFPDIQSWETPVPNQEVKLILEKPFIFLSKGKQSDVFLSQDGKYVLKFFRFDMSQFHWGRKVRAAIKKIFRLKQNDIGLHRMNRVYSTFQSCKIAYDLIPHLTKLVYVHLNLKSHVLPKIKVKGRFGFFYEIDPAQYRFVIQKRGLSLESAVQIASMDELHHIKTSLFTMLDQLSQAGVANTDRASYKNFHICEKEAIVSDVGSFFYDPIRAKEDSIYFKSQLESFLKRNDS